MANPDVGKDATQLVSEEEALARARNSPGQALPLRVVFAPGDRDNPRCWGFWRKWWITCFVSMLNVVTYVSPKDIDVHILTVQNLVCRWLFVWRARDCRAF